MTCYSVHRCEFGYYIKGNISVNELLSLLNSWGYKYSREAWRKSLGITDEWVNRCVDEYENGVKK